LPIMEQLFANILFSSSTIFIVGISFSLIFSTARFFHFAHAAVITSGAYLFFACSQLGAIPVSLSVIFALIASAGIGWCLELAAYRQMRHKGASPLILLLASLGLYILLQNGISMLFGDDTKVISGANVASTFTFFEAKMTLIQIVVVGFAGFILIAKIFIIDKTRIGLALRAVANSPDLAEVSGIEFDKTMGIAFCLGSFLAGCAGLSRAFDVGMTPTMGLPMLLLGVVAVILGGMDKTFGIAIASILLASFQEISGWHFGTQWEEAIAFLLLLSFLIFRPQGLFGRALKNTTV
jgi:branched-chain amino acid transport system permease protein